MQVCGVFVSGPWPFRPRSAFLPGTCDTFRPLVRSAVAGPRTFRGPATPRPRTCDTFWPLVVFLLQVHGRSVSGPSVFCPRSAFSPGTCDAFRPLVRSGVAGPRTFRGPATPWPVTCDIFGLWCFFCCKSVAFPLQVLDLSVPGPRFPLGPATLFGLWCALPSPVPAHFADLHHFAP